MIMSDPQPLVPGIQGDSLMAQINKLFEPPGCISLDGESLLDIHLCFIT